MDARKDLNLIEEPAVAGTLRAVERQVEPSRSHGQIQSAEGGGLRGSVRGASMSITDDPLLSLAAASRETSRQRLLEAARADPLGSEDRRVQRQQRTSDAGVEQ